MRGRRARAKDDDDEKRMIAWVLNERREHFGHSFQFTEMVLPQEAIVPSRGGYKKDHGKR